MFLLLIFLCRAICSDALHHRVRLRLWRDNADSSVEIRQLMLFSMDEPWHSILDRARARMRAPAGAMTFIDPLQSEPHITHHEPLRVAAASGSTVLVHVLAGKLVSKRIIFGRRKRGNETVWLGASDLEEARVAVPLEMDFS